jgi:hypothetical protein
VKPLKSIDILRLLILGIYVLAISCSKKEIDSNQQSAIDNAFSETTFIQAFSMAHSAGLLSINGTSGFFPDSCSTWKVENDLSMFPNSGPKIISVTYGQGCARKDKAILKGTISGAFDFEWSENASWLEVSFKDFSIDNHKVDGLIQVEKLGLNYYLFVKNGLIHTPEGKIGYNGHLDVLQIEGEKTLTPFDDVFSIKAKASGMDRRGREFQSKITENYIKRQNCYWIESGIATVKPKELPERILNYGVSNCRNSTVVTISGLVYEVELR